MQLCVTEPHFQICMYEMTVTATPTVVPYNECENVTE